MKDIFIDMTEKVVGTWNEVLNSRVKTAQVVASTALFVLVSAFYVASDIKYQNRLQEEAKAILREKVLTQFFDAHGTPTDKFQLAMRRGVYDGTKCERIQEAHELVFVEKSLFFKQCENVKKQISNLLHDLK